MNKRTGAAISGICSAVGLAAVIGGVLLVDWPKADALPSFARQTGQQCAACHNGFPELTPYGRLFKLNGYTFGGGSASKLGHFAGMILGSYNNTQGNQTGGAGGGTPHFGPNGNFAVDQVSLFYAGALTQHLGMFSQFTYDGIGRQFHWDNLDIRYARTATLFGDETVVGISVNNNPTVQDVWNTEVGGWGYPYAFSKLGSGGAPATALEGGFAQYVAGVTAYAYWNRLVYAEVGAYKTLDSATQCAFGVGCGAGALGDNSSIENLAPYWRLALQRDWGRNSAEIGFIGLAASMTPGRVNGAGRDHFVDVGFDGQYQFLADRNSYSAQFSEILENQSWTASSGLGATANTHDTLRSFRLKGTYYRDQTYGLTLAVNRVDGSPDAGIYGATGTFFSPPGTVTNGSPNTTALTAELNYIPFNHGGPSLWPWLNARFGLQYTAYTELNGVTGGAALRNNLLYAYTWLAF